MNDLHRLIYISRSTLPAEVRTDELHAILARSRKANHLAGITGVLLCSKGYFCQVIEGNLQPLELLFETIQLDDRHTDVTVLEFIATSERLFGAWDMAHVDLDEGGPEETSIKTAMQRLQMAATGRSMVRVFADLIGQREAFRA
ncbi:hypothetical protein CAP39_13330 [Sphingomonas sp. IBVSS1]|nr:hypothetical protein CAP39_13330 [Sphingomonas sp. IBVSS1]